MSNKFAKTLLKQQFYDDEVIKTLEFLPDIYSAAILSCTSKRRIVYDFDALCAIFGVLTGRSQQEMHRGGMQDILRPEVEKLKRKPVFIYRFDSEQYASNHAIRTALRKNEYTSVFSSKIDLAEPICKWFGGVTIDCKPVYWHGVDLLCDFDEDAHPHYIFSGTYFPTDRIVDDMIL